MDIVLDNELIELFEPVKGLEKNPLIYTLLDPNNNEVKYIGKSISGITRPRSHIAPSNIRNDAGTKKANWLNSLLKQNKKPIIKIIEYLYYNIDKETANDILYLKEQRYIKLFKEFTTCLTNNTDGGPGAINRQISEETRKRMSESATISGYNRYPIKNHAKFLLPDTETQKHCSKCKIYKDFNQFNKDKNHCKICTSKKGKRIIPGKKEAYWDSKKFTLIKIDPVTNIETIMLGIKATARTIGGKCNHNGIKLAIKNNTIYYGFYWRLK